MKQGWLNQVRCALCVSRHDNDQIYQQKLPCEAETVMSVNVKKEKKLLHLLASI